MSNPPLEDWIEFSKRLPTLVDATDGKVQALLRNRSVRLAMWDWIPPAHVDAKELWSINGFIAWRRINREST